MRPTREELEVMFLAALLGNANPNLYENANAVDYVTLAAHQAKSLMTFWAERDAQEADHG